MKTEKALVSIPEGDIEVQRRIRTLRGVQVMLDRDLALLYGVETGQLNRHVKRNMDRFPSDFMFQLTKDDVENLKCQFGISSWGGDRHLPYAFTETGVAMLSGILRSKTAVTVNIRIMRAFVAMRRALASMAPVLSRVESAERRLLIQEDAQQRNEERFEKIFDAMQDKKFPPQKIFFDGQFYDAFVWLKKYIRMARQELIVLDPYFAASVLPQIALKRDGVSVVIVQCKRGRKLLPDVDVQMFNAQYKNSLTVKESERFHDRYFIIDRKTLVHIGASLNYFGKKCFACSTFDPIDIPEMLAKLQM